MAIERGEAPFLYDAFISYRHVARDRKWAEWLISALEGYRTPAPLQKLGAPPRLRKIFRDEDEVPASGDLNDQIRQALVASRFLIVVCSPYTPRSAWVQREIEMFNELGRGDQVLALLTEGEPSDSFPAPILERIREVAEPDGTRRIIKEPKEPLAADVRPRSGVYTGRLKHMALLRLVAVMLGVKYDDLYQREKQRVRSRQIAWAAAATALIVTILGGGLGYWEVTRPKVAYFRDLVMRWQIPEGLGPIGEATRAHLAASFRIVTERGKVVDVRHENTEGSLVPTEIYAYGGIARWALRYRADGSLESDEMSDATDRVVYDESYERDPATGHLVVNLKKGTTPIAQDAVARSLVPHNATEATGNTEITRQERTFDDNGYVDEVRFQNYLGAPLQDANGEYGVRFARSPAGLPTRMANIGIDGSETALKNGWLAASFDYDSDNRLVRAAYLGADDRPIDGPDEVATMVFEYDSYGNLASRHDFAADGAPTQRTGACATRLHRYDERGRAVEDKCLGADGKPTLSTNGYARYVTRYDEHAYDVAYFGVGGEPVLGPDGCARISRGFDERGHLVRQDCQSADGKPDIDKFGRWRFTSVFDPSGNQIEFSTFGVDGKPALALPDFCARWTAAFDARDNRTLRRCYGADGNRSLDLDGASEIKSEYDLLGNLIAVSYLGIDGLPTIVAGWGCSGFKNAWDRNGALTERTFVGVDDKPSLNSSGFARAAFRYDQRGNQTEARYFDADGRPTMNKEGYAKFTSEFDARAQPTRVSFFGIAGEPTLIDGVAASDRVYDAKGNRIAESHFGVDGKPALNKEGCAKYTSLYDSRGNRIEMTCFGVDGLPAVNRSGYTTDTVDFDAAGREIERAYFDVAREPTLADGVAKTRLVYGPRGKVTEISYFGNNGAPTLNKDGYARMASIDDSRGNDVEDRYFGVDGRLAATKQGYALRRRRNDERNRLIEEDDFGPDEKPILNSEGFAKLVLGYDTRGNETKRAWFGVGGEPTLVKGIAKQIAIFDAHRHLVVLSYFGVEGAPIEKKDIGAARTTFAYNERNKIVEQVFFGADGKLGNHNGIARVAVEFDNRNKLRQIAFFGPDGKPTVNGEGSARNNIDFDPRGNEIEAGHFGVDGNPTLGTVGWATRRRKYDERSQLVREAFFGADGLPILARVGYARIDYSYDLRGHQTERAYFGPDDKPLAFSFGYARVATSWDDWGQVFEEHYFDAAGREIPVGVVVTKVRPDSLAQQMQFAAGDRLLTYAGRKVTSPKQIADLVLDPWLGDTRVLTMLRASQVLTFRAPPGRLGMDVKLVVAEAQTEANPQ
jgi:hypothetical protein